MAFRLPPSPFPLRRALSLTEVLIAMGILTLGLLGVAALFPVGSFYMQKADIADRGSAIAQAVMSDIVSQGMLNPGAWFVMVPWAGISAPANATFPSDGKYAPVPQPVNISTVHATFARPFAHTLLEALNQPAAATDATLIGKQFGSAFVIDPMGMAVLARPNGLVPSSPYAHSPASTFPASASQAWTYYAKYPNWGSSLWSPWSGGTGSGGHPFQWPVRRVTFRQPDTAWQMGKTMAEHYFRGHDDLATDFPQRDDRPAVQNWDRTTVGGTQMPLSRQWTGDYSWIVTVVPTTNAARDGMARNPEGHSYDVSVVVFYKRPLPDDAESVYPDLGSSLPNYLSVMGENERAVKASVVSSGLSGGELLLTDFGDDFNKKSPFGGLRSGQWIMLCGPHPNSNVREPRFVLNWYQVLAIDTEGTGITPGFDPIKQRVVAVRGPQWPWQPNLTYSDDVANNLCVAICRGAVAVHTKTMRLESPRSAPAMFGGGSSIKTTPPRDKLY
ncbi:MAG: hypothetical protein WD738_23360 [Pirellulales bacterium]